MSSASDMSGGTPADSPPRGSMRGIAAPAGGALAAALAEGALAFNRGDFRRARALAREALSCAPSDDERAFAEEVLRRTRADPLALVLGTACLVAFAMVVFLTFPNL